MRVVRLNGEAQQVPDDATLADVVALLTDATQGIAVAVDDAVVPRSSWAATTVAEGARVEVLTAVQGG